MSLLDKISHSLLLFMFCYNCLDTKINLDWQLFLSEEECWDECFFWSSDDVFTNGRVKDWHQMIIWPKKAFNAVVTSLSIMGFHEPRSFCYYIVSDIKMLQCSSLLHSVTQRRYWREHFLRAACSRAATLHRASPSVRSRVNVRIFGNGKIKNDWFIWICFRLGPQQDCFGYN